MMKQLFLLLFVLSSLSCFGDDDYSKFGNVNPKDLKVTKYNIDSSAGAIRIFDLGYFNINSDLEPSLAVHERIKILKKSGFENGNIKIRFVAFNGREKISQLKAETIWMDENGEIQIKKVEENQIYITKLNNIYSEVAFSFPNIQIGSILEYTYTKFYPNSRTLPTWFFQSALPTLTSQYTIEVPGKFQYTSLSQGIEVQKNQLTREEKTVYTADDPKYPNSIRIYSMTDIPAIEREVYSNAITDNIDKVSFYFRSYAASRLVGHGNFFSVANESWEAESEKLFDDPYFGAMLKPFKKINDWFENKFATNTKGLNLAIKIRNDVVNNIKWNESYSIYSFKPLSDVIDQKEGNSAEINFVLLGLLKAAGFNVKAAILSTKENGTPLMDFPNSSQFNHTICVLYLNNNKYVMDATTNNPWYMLPINFNDRDVVILDKDSTKTLKISNEIGYTSTQKNTLTISETGKLNWKIATNYEGYAREKELKKFTQTSAQKYAASKINISSYEVDSIKYLNEKIDSIPFETTIYFSQNDDKSNINSFYIHLVPISEFENPFITEHRISDIDLQHKYYFEIKSTINFPTKFKLKDYPNEVQFASEDGNMTFSRNVIASEKQVRIKINVEILQKNYPAQSYGEVKKFFSSVSKALRDEITIERNEK